MYCGFEDLVVHSEQGLIELVVVLLTSETKVFDVERRMQAYIVAGRGMHNRDRILCNLEIAVPAMVHSVERAGGDRWLLNDIDLIPHLPPMERGGGPRVVPPETPMAETPEAQCERVLCQMNHRRDFGRRSAEALKVLVFAVRHGLSLQSVAGTGAYNHSVRAVYTKEGNGAVSSGSHVILKLMHGGRSMDRHENLIDKRWRQIRRISSDQNFGAVDFMDTASKTLARTLNLRYVIKARPVFSTARGQCSAGYLAFKEPIGPAKWAMTFHCCEALPSYLYKDDSYLQMFDEFRQTGYISPARTQFEQGLFHIPHAGYPPLETFVYSGPFAWKPCPEEWTACAH